MRILLIAENVLEKDRTYPILIAEHYTVDCCFGADSGADSAASGIYDVVIITTGADSVKGRNALLQIRKTDKFVPVMMVSLAYSLNDAVDFLDIGADDYCSERICRREFLARIRASARRRGVLSPVKAVFGDLTLDVSTYEIYTTAGALVSVSTKDLEILRMLMEHDGRVVSREQLILKAWGYNSEAEYNRADVYMSHLRRKIRLAGSRVQIIPVRGVGYKLVFNQNADE